jgi:hypothetical protein
MCFFVAKKPKGRFWTGLSRLAEAFSLDWLPSSPRQPHSPLERILVKTAAGSIAPEQKFLCFMSGKHSPIPRRCEPGSGISLKIRYIDTVAVLRAKKKDQPADD